MTSRTKHSARAVAVTVCGHHHMAEKRPNEDACLARCEGFGGLVAVSDGLGSRTLSRHGSQAAVMAALHAARAWAKYPSASPRELILLVEAYWRLLIAPHKPDDCAATLIFAVADRYGSLTVCSLGDGTALVEAAGSLVRLGQRPEAAFANETIALGLPHKAVSWQVHTGQAAGSTVVLATDGVADDLNPAKLNGLPRVLRRQLQPLGAPEQKRVLKEALRSWPIPRHGDDKSIGLLWWPA